MNDSTKTLILIPLALSVLFIAIMVLLIVGKDTIIELLTPKSDLERNVIFIAAMVAGVVMLYFTLRHVDVVKKK